MREYALRRGRTIAPHVREAGSSADRAAPKGEKCTLTLGGLSGVDPTTFGQFEPFGISLKPGFYNTEQASWARLNSPQGVFKLEEDLARYDKMREELNMKVHSLVVIAGLLLRTTSTSAQLMEGKAKIPSIAAALPEVWRFIQELTEDVNTGAIISTEQLTKRCREFYTPKRMAEIDRIVPGWKHMASFEDGNTLWHTNEAMVALLQLDEYRSMVPQQQTVQQWIVFLHDVAKEPAGSRDHRHSFRSAAQAGRIMPKLGFPVTAAYASVFQDWFSLANTATRFDEMQKMQVQDNRKLPQILGGVRRIFAEPTRTAVSAIALHQSITSLAAWPVKAPLTDDEIKASIDKDVLPVLLVLTLADSAGWNLFDRSTLESMYKETREVFGKLSRSFTK